MLYSMYIRSWEDMKETSLCPKLTSSSASSMAQTSNQVVELSRWYVGLYGTRQKFEVLRNSFRWLLSYVVLQRLALKSPKIMR